MDSQTPHLLGHHRPLREVIHRVANDDMPSETGISEVVANSNFDRSQKVLDCIPAPLRFISDTSVDMSCRVALTQRLIKVQLLELEISAGGHLLLLAKS